MKGLVADFIKYKTKHWHRSAYPNAFAIVFIYGKQTFFKVKVIFNTFVSLIHIQRHFICTMMKCKSLEIPSHKHHRVDTH